MVTINLGQDETDCFCAWVNAKDAGLVEGVDPDHKVNYGRLMRQALLQNWRNFEADADSPGNIISVPPHTPVVLRLGFINIIFSHLRSLKLRVTLSCNRKMIKKCFSTVK